MAQPHILVTMSHVTIFLNMVRIFNCFSFKPPSLEVSKMLAFHPDFFVFSTEAFEKFAKWGGHFARVESSGDQNLTMRGPAFCPLVWREAWKATCRNICFSINLVW